MKDTPEWLPSLFEFTGEWNTFVDEVYEQFCGDFIRRQILFQGLRISVRRHPESCGKSFGFWHCVSDGALEDERIPDLERCRRIGWIRVIIENCDKSDVEHWTNQRRGETSHLLWCREEYLVVLAERDGYFLLKTAYLTNRSHTHRKLRKECDQAKNG